MLRLAPVTDDQLVRWSAPKFRMPPRGGVPPRVYPFPPRYLIARCEGGCPACEFGMCCGWIPWAELPISSDRFMDALRRHQDGRRSDGE